jgi:hypothetical protein
MEAALEESIRNSVLCLLEETLHSHQGVYLAEGTSLIETLAGIDSALASRPYSGLQETIAGHAHHANYYLRNTIEMLQGKSDGSFDVSESWKLRLVASAEWDALRQDLAKTYESVMTLVGSAPLPDLVRALPAIMGLFAHTAYHLGAIRQLKEIG